MGNGTEKEEEESWVGGTWRMEADWAPPVGLVAPAILYEAREGLSYREERQACAGCLSPRRSPVQVYQIAYTETETSV